MTYVYCICISSAFGNIGNLITAYIQTVSGRRQNCVICCITQSYFGKLHLIFGSNAYRFTSLGNFNVFTSINSNGFTVFNFFIR